jgi:septum formation protein
MRINPDINRRKIVLASESPRRADLLSKIGLEFEVIPTHIPETRFPDLSPLENVLCLSRKKVREAAGRVSDGLIIGADTIVVLDNEIIGKPEDSNQAFNMLKKLSGRVHEVITAFTLLDQITGFEISDYEITRVHFNQLDDEEIWDYISSCKPYDKAGSYGIQDKSATFVKKVEGCFYNVVGFPLSRFWSRVKEGVRSGGIKLHLS